MPFEYLKNVSYEDIDLLETKSNIIVQDKETLGKKMFTKMMLPLLKLDTNYGFHELFLK
jgi:hypothetical protein